MSDRVIFFRFHAACGYFFEHLTFPRLKKIAPIRKGLAGQGFLAFFCGWFFSVLSTISVDNTVHTLSNTLYWQPLKGLSSLFPMCQSPRMGFSHILPSFLYLPGRVSWQEWLYSWAILKATIGFLRWRGVQNPDFKAGRVVVPGIFFRHFIFVNAIHGLGDLALA